ncbi:hypothetical protein O6H91_17G081700 [Diphasiastrum complanatum]|uniref:Uncharacterized protein n=1 Tax=Diphasiastrum complanatum TaxID=34168 RepID=A0ACC2B8Q3_DIPCM|nr:hypothetical protein O6H91_17G081700 [Diphasiastrum complanatum]
MAMSVHCGSPQIAFTCIPRAMRVATRKGHASLHSCSTCGLLVRECCFSEELRSSMRKNRKAGSSRQLIGCRSLYFYGYGLMPCSFWIARSFSSARVSSLEDFKETDYEGEHRFEEEELVSSNSKDASLSKEKLETQHLKELVDSMENELQSVRNAIRAVERENESLQELCDGVCNELEDLKLEKGMIGISEPTISSFSSSFVAAEQQQIRKGACSRRKEDESTCLVATDESKTSSSAAFLKIGTIDSSERAVNSYEDGDDYSLYRFTDEITSMNSNILNVKGIKDHNVPRADDQKKGETVVGLVKAVKKERKASYFDPLDSAKSYPWPEWTAFLRHLKKHNYFSSDWEDNFFEGDGGVEFYARVKKATMKFGRDRNDIFESFPKNDLKVLARFGCPSTDRKVVNAGKRLRGHFEISEFNVCQPCSLKTTCARAYSESCAGMAGTIDVVRLLMQFSLDAGGPDAKLSLPTQVKISILNLLVEAVELSKAPRDPNLSRPEIRGSFNRPVESRKKLKAGQEQIEMKPGDWRCSECRYVNYSRNSECRDCRAERPRRFSSQKDRSINSMRTDRFFDESQGSRERQAFVHRERYNRRYPLLCGDFSSSIGGTCLKREEWKLDLNKAKQKLDNGFDADARGRTLPKRKIIIPKLNQPSNF